MTTLFAFLHHLCAFTLVAAVAIVTDLALGMTAGALPVIGLLRVFRTD